MSNYQVKNRFLHSCAHMHTHKTHKHGSNEDLFQSEVSCYVMIPDDVLTSTFIVAVWSASAVKRNHSHVVLIYSAVPSGQGVTTEQF